MSIFLKIIVKILIFIDFITIKIFSKNLFLSFNFEKNCYNINTNILLEYKNYSSRLEG